jgi:hypothetical protein
VTGKNAEGRSADEWSYTAGDRGYTVTAKETGKNKVVNLVWYVDRKNRSMSLRYGIRDSHGRVIKKLERAVKKAADEKAESLRTGVESEQPTPLTIEQGFDEYFDLHTGNYASESRQRQDMLRASVIVKDQLGRTALWANCRSLRDARRIWRSLASQYATTGKGGPRWTVRVVGLFFACARWLRSEGRLEPGVCVAPEEWESKLIEDWQRRTKTPVVVDTPRHSPSELEAVLEALDDERVDRRMALLIDAGAERRAGQVRRCRRSDLRLTPAPGAPHGSLMVHGAGKKSGALIYLTPEQRARFDHALGEGYLSELEQSYKTGALDDFCLFPQGMLTREGKARRSFAQKHVARRTVLGWFRKLEAVAGVEHRHGRGWYGLRRQAADLMEDFTSDDRVLNAEGGWKDSRTRRKYQESERPKILAAAADARRQVRGAVGSYSRTEHVLTILASAGIPELAMEQIKAILTAEPPAEPATDTGTERDSV